MTAPRPFAEYVAALKKHIEDDEPFEVILPLTDARAILSRLASREAVFEAAVAWADEPFYPQSQENYHVQMMRHSARAKALRAAIEAARALDAATPQGEEKAK